MVLYNGFLTDEGVASRLQVYSEPTLRTIFSHNHFCNAMWSIDLLSFSVELAGSLKVKIFGLLLHKACLCRTASIDGIAVCVPWNSDDNRSTGYSIFMALQKLYIQIMLLCNYCASIMQHMIHDSWID